MVTESKSHASAAGSTQFWANYTHISWSVPHVPGITICGTGCAKTKNRLPMPFKDASCDLVGISSMRPTTRPAGSASSLCTRFRNNWRSCGLTPYATNLFPILLSGKHSWLAFCRLRLSVFVSILTRSISTCAPMKRDNTKRPQITVLIYLSGGQSGLGLLDHCIICPPGEESKMPSFHLFKAVDMGNAT